MNCVLCVSPIRMWMWMVVVCCGCACVRRARVCCGCMCVENELHFVLAMDNNLLLHTSIVLGADEWVVAVCSRWCMHGIAVHSASLGKMEWDDGGKMAAENSISFYVFYRWRYAFGLKINIDILCMIFNSTSLYLLCVCVWYEWYNFGIGLVGCAVDLHLLNALHDFDGYVYFPIFLFVIIVKQMECCYQS